MLLIQTAFQQEFGAVTAALRREDSEHRQPSARPLPMVSGFIGGHRCCVLKTGIGASSAQRAVEKAFQAAIDRPTLLVSIGFAGALRPDFSVHDCRIIRAVRREGGEPCELFAALDRLATDFLRATGDEVLLTVEQPLLDPASKAACAHATAAGLCDMETHAVAKVALAHGVPWIGARVVSDSSQESLKQWMLQLPTLIERRRWSDVFRLLATHPQDLPGLLRLAHRMRTLQRRLSQFTSELILNVVES